MTAGNPLDGIMKYSRRDEWAQDHEKVAADHFSDALEEFDLDFAGLADLVGEHWSGSLIGCVLEDFISRTFDPGGRNLADMYLKRRGWREDTGSKSYIKALRNSTVSLYELSDIVPGASFAARDLLRGGEPVVVIERLATRTLKQWDKISARIVPAREGFVMSGASLPFSAAAAANLIKAMRKFAGKGRAMAKLPLGEQSLRPGASLFTTAWLFDILPKAMGHNRPVFANTDGDRMLFHKIRFPLAAGTAPAAVAAKLDAVAALDRVDAGAWKWCGPPPPGDDIREGEGGVVLGNLALTGRHLELSVNSEPRARRGTSMLQQVLGKLVRSPLTSIQTVDQMRAEPQATPARKQDVPREDETRVIHDLMQRHYRANLDLPIPALGNKSPRDAVKTEKGRQNVSGWLKDIENRTAGSTGVTDPMNSFDFGWMWQELGIGHLRR